jgi:hypothetical protein
MSDTCMYWINDERCGHPLGPWVPTKVDLDSVTDVMTRTCEKCGGEQSQFRSTDPETNQAIDQLFKELKESE